MKINQIDKKIDSFLGRKLGRGYTEINNWCNRHLLMLLLSAIVLIVILLNMKHIK